MFHHGSLIQRYLLQSPGTDDADDAEVESQEERSRSPRAVMSDSPVKIRQVQASSNLTGDFWLSPKDLQGWQDEATKESVKFQARLVLPTGQRPRDGPMAIAFFFSGLGHEAQDILDMDWSSVASFPFILVVPNRPAGRWWFIDDDTHWGWLQGKFNSEAVATFASWMNHMISHERVDRQRVGLFGFSAGAYAAVEIFASGLVPVTGFALGGVHGHGQPNLKHVPVARTRGVVKKFEAFLERVAEHPGAHHVEVIHGRTDLQSPWQDAKEILETLSRRQQQLQLPKVVLRLLRAHEQDAEPSSHQNKTHHDYLKAAFMRREFFEAMLADKAKPKQAAKMAAKGRRSSAPWGPMSSSLQVAMFSVSSSAHGWEDAAFKIFRHSGFVIIEDVLNLAQCHTLWTTCESLAKEIVGPTQAGNRGPGRYSFGVASSTGSILHVPAIAENLLDASTRKLRALLDYIFRSGFLVYSGGGDFVLPHVDEAQKLHSDMQVARRLDVDMPPPLVSVNFCIQELTSLNGPMRIVPGKRDRDWNGKREPAKWQNSRLCPVPAGAALVRDVRVLHGGTANATDRTRYLPSVEFVSGPFRATNRADLFPPQRCLPPDIFERLHPEVKELCEELVAEIGDGTEGNPAWDSPFWHGVTFTQK
ncbi:unnamed protein product [Effrenium voratum]|uniref:Uncharacterized protein n=1 Tax=Effrenium voratum TaxID=2562239 RepID=A0AA36MT95_9DINO|nr:unnamed protein product [Effrenium voratum]CAJ1378152.1 unnamed protein product [Effrenium voratum]CAJ1451767.1 unnamed protein product [Effrenium voratum]